MSLLHQPQYTLDYDEEADTQGLGFLRWSQFGCKCGKCNVNSGKNYMERQPVLILDDIAREERMRFDVLLGYVCEKSAYKDHFLPTKDSHRVGLAVKITLSPGQIVVVVALIDTLTAKGVSIVAVTGVLPLIQFVVTSSSQS